MKTEEEYAKDLEDWLRRRREEKAGNSFYWNAINELLDEVRDAAATGHLATSPQWEILRTEIDL